MIVACHGWTSYNWLELVKYTVILVVAFAKEIDVDMALHDFLVLKLPSKIQDLFDCIGLIHT